MVPLIKQRRSSTKTYHLPLRLISAANSREHWAARARRVKRERNAAIVVRKYPLPCIVTITRHGRRLMDGDNLQAACKALRDGIADRLAVDDADPRVVWRYEQNVQPEYSVTVHIQVRNDAAKVAAGPSRIGH